jgi:3-dehydroquinate dehydratase/shikimate dehydrogenase
LQFVRTVNVSAQVTLDMLCVAVGRSRHQTTIAQHQHLAEQGAELVELRLDYIQGPINVKRLLADRPGPVMITCRRERDGGKFTGSEESRLLLLRTAITEGAEYIDLEEDVAAGVPRFGRTKRVISYHNFRNTPPNVDDIHYRMRSFDPDVIKLATIRSRPASSASARWSMCITTTASGATRPCSE